MSKWHLLLITWTLPALAGTDRVTEFCLAGEFDLGARLQGMAPQSSETYPTSWCVITEDDSPRVRFSGAGKSNPDMDGGWTVAYPTPDLVRIVNRQAPPDVEFHGVDNSDEAARVRRVDPRRLVEEFRSTPNSLTGLRIEFEEERLLSVTTSAALPLRGRVAVIWNWDWSNPSKPALRLMVDNELLFEAIGTWRDLTADESSSVWDVTPGAEPIEVPGDRWPARINMQIIDLTDGVYLVRGVRTGFQHLVVDTDEGLVVADAPAGWVEFHHIPPSDLVPGLGVSGLSEKFIEFLGEQFEDRPIFAVALTHFHDDHAGGARAFAARGAEIYSTAESAGFFESALNRSSMPKDQLTQRRGSLQVRPVADTVILGREPNRVKLMSMGEGPHAYAMLGVWALDKDYFFVSDVHVPRSDADAPRKERAVTECWFAEWAVNKLPPEVRVINSHSDSITPVSRLADYLESDLCKAL